MHTSSKSGSHKREIYVTWPLTAQSLCIEADTTSQTLAEALWLSGKIAPMPLCSGLGNCGACKVRFLSAPPKANAKEEKILSPTALTEGWRLACQQVLERLFAQQNSISLELPPQKNKELVYNIQETQPKNTHALMLAVDLGTTSLCWQALDSAGNCIAQGSQLNPQMGAGADIISRLRFASQAHGQELLSTLVQKNLQNILESLPQNTPVQEIGLAANTAMTAIFLEKDITGLCHAPYSLPLQGNSQEEKQDLPPIYIPPQLAPFVGGDISAGYAALMQRQKHEKDIAFPFLLADLGTNGEFILALNEHKAFIASVPLGPALEGIGLSHGHMVDGSPGIVHTIRLDPTAPSGLKPVTLDGSAPQKICGTGYISLIQTLSKAGLLSAEGLFLPEYKRKKTPFIHKIAANLTSHQGEKALHLWPAHSINPMYLYAKDVEEMLKVKAAFSLAMSALLKEAGLAPKDLRHIFLAGAMGKHVQIQDLEGLGFIPQGAGARVYALGNSALEGMGHLLLQKSLREDLYTWSKNCTLVHLTEDEHFTEKFMQHMNFSYTG